MGARREKERPTPRSGDAPRTEAMARRSAVEAELKAEALEKLT